MPGVDANVLVRYLIRDDQPQYEKARRLIDREAAGSAVAPRRLSMVEP
jgi:predicted nucleic acid-binding protein